ncbi:MAG: hypothetical protein QXX20_05770 [Candidatus Thermoplasmatota archaeon]
MADNTQKILEAQKIIKEIQKIMELQQSDHTEPRTQSIAQPPAAPIQMPEPSHPHQHSTMILNHHQRWTEQSIVFCDLCKKEMQLGRNLSGLIVENTFFACEECCTKTPHNDMVKWAQSKMLNKNTVRPIGLWLTQETNKQKTILFKP